MLWNELFSSYLNPLDTDTVNVWQEEMEATLKPPPTNDELCCAVRSMSKLEYRHKPNLSDLVSALNYYRGCKAGCMVKELEAKIRFRLRKATPAERWDLICDSPGLMADDLMAYGKTLPGGVDRGMAEDLHKAVQGIMDSQIAGYGE